jgi:antitoxin component of MazEF toxin-antitoxin module
MSEFETRKTMKLGDSLAVTIPYEYAEKLNIEEGIILKVTIMNGKIVMEVLK